MAKTIRVQLYHSCTLEGIAPQQSLNTGHYERNVFSQKQQCVAEELRGLRGKYWQAYLKEETHMIAKLFHVCKF